MSKIVVMVTEREAQVAYALIYDGAQNDIIARRLRIELDTVKSHMKALLRKTGLDNRTALAVAILREDVVLRGPIYSETSWDDVLAAPRFRQTPFAESRTRLCPAPRSSAAPPAAMSAS